MHKWELRPGGFSGLGRHSREGACGQLRWSRSASQKGTRCCCRELRERENGGVHFRKWARAGAGSRGPGLLRCARFSLEDARQN